MFFVSQLKGVEVITVEIRASDFVKSVLDKHSSDREFQQYKEAFRNAESFLLAVEKNGILVEDSADDFSSFGAESQLAARIGAQALSRSEIEMALWAFEGGVILTGGNAQLWLGLAIALYSKEPSPSSSLLKACKICLKTALQLKPHYMAALEFLDDISDPDDELTAMIERTGLILKEHPEYADQHHLLGVCLIEQCRYIEALHEFNAALAINPNLIRTILQRALLLVLMERFEEAIVDFRLLLDTVGTKGSFLSFPEPEKDRDFEQIIESVNFYEREANYSAACEVFSELFHVAPNIAATLLRNGKVFYQAELYQVALKEAEAAIVMAPTYADGHWLIGMLAIKAGDYNKALLSLTSALELNPFYEEAASEAVSLWQKNGETGRIDSLRKKWEEKGKELPSWFYR
jgi:tetratricopeptide (TPR) repeat protein